MDYHRFARTVLVKAIEDLDETYAESIFGEDILELVRRDLEFSLDHLRRVSSIADFERMRDHYQEMIERKERESADAMKVEAEAAQ